MPQSALWIYLVLIPSFLANLLLSLCFALLFPVLLLLRSGHGTAAKILLTADFMLPELILVLILFPASANLQYYFFLIAPVTYTMYDFEIRKERNLNCRPRRTA